MPDTREVLRRSIEAWNAHDRQRWTEFAADDIELVVSGGVRLRGLEGARQYDTWTTAFPDNRVSRFWRWSTVRPAFTSRTSVARTPGP